MRFLYRLYRWQSSLRHFVERRFTRAGLGVLAACGVAAVMGPDTENNVAYQGFTILLFLLTLAVVWSWFFRGRFAARRVLPRFGTVGQPLRYTVTVSNRGKKAQTGLTLLETLADPRPSFREWVETQRAERKHARSFRISQGTRTFPFKRATLKETAVPVLSPGRETEVAIELTPSRRGLLRFEAVTLARPDPLGLFRSFVRVNAPQTALILPRRYPLPPIALPGSMKYQQGGVALASNVGRSDEFVALRDYRRGDPLRHIHWRSWARAGKPVVKEFEDEFFVRHALVLDTFTDHPASVAFEEAVSIAASFACTLQTQESLLDLLFVGTQSYCFTSGRGLAHADQMLEILASVTPCRDRSFGSLHHLVFEHIKAVSGCICVLLSWNEERRDFVKKLKLLGVPLMVLVVAEPGGSKNIDPGPMRDDMDRFKILEVGKVEKGLAEIA